MLRWAVPAAIGGRPAAGLPSNAARSRPSNPPPPLPPRSREKRPSPSLGKRWTLTGSDRDIRRQGPEALRLSTLPIRKPVPADRARIPGPVQASG